MKPGAAASGNGVNRSNAIDGPGHPVFLSFPVSLFEGRCQKDCRLQKSANSSYSKTRIEGIKLTSNMHHCLKLSKPKIEANEELITVRSVIYIEADPRPVSLQVS